MFDNKQPQISAAYNINNKGAAQVFLQLSWVSSPFSNPADSEASVWNFSRSCSKGKENIVALHPFTWQRNKMVSVHPDTALNNYVTLWAWMLIICISVSMSRASYSQSWCQWGGESVILTQVEAADIPAYWRLMYRGHHLTLSQWSSPLVSVIGLHWSGHGEAKTVDWWFGEESTLYFLQYGTAAAFFSVTREEVWQKDWNMQQGRVKRSGTQETRTSRISGTAHSEVVHLRTFQWYIPTNSLKPVWIRTFITCISTW